MQEFVKQVSGDANLPLVPEEQIDFTLKLYDLNQVRCCCCGVLVSVFVGVCTSLQMLVCTQLCNRAPKPAR